MGDVPLAPGDIIDASVIVGGGAGDIEASNLVIDDIIVSAGYTSGAGSAAVPQSINQVGAVIPEASVSLLAGLACGGLLRRRRR